MDDKAMKHGAFGWMELMTTDMKAAKTFYTDLFGWEINKLDHSGEMPYDVIKVDGEEVAGLMTIPPQAEGTPPCWGCYITVDDVIQVSEKVKALGGNLIVPPTDIPDVGKFCVLQDPQGAVISAITYVEKKD